MVSERANFCTIISGFVFKNSFNFFLEKKVRKSQGCSSVGSLRTAA